MDDFSPFKDNVALSPIALGAILVLGLSMLCVPRRRALLPLVLMACFIPQGQRIALGPFNFNMIRVMVVFGWLRLLMRGEIAGFRRHSIDMVLVCWAMAKAAIYVTLWQSGEAIVFQLGQGFDALGMYFLFRVLVRTWDDIDHVTTSFVLVGIPVALAFLLEGQTGHNIFSVFGGVPELTGVREGHRRCQGAFPHPIIAGAFWATLLPLIVARWWGGLSARTLTVVGSATCFCIVTATWSSTSFGAVLVGSIGGLLVLVRVRMRQVRWCLAAALLMLHFVIMKGPVWSLLGHIDLAGGSTGAYRSVLIDLAVHNFHDWWLIGTKSTLSWSQYYRDITDQYVLEGIQGGFLGLVLFVALFVAGFSTVGRVWRRLTNQPARLAVAWAVGVSLLVHVMNFFVTAYFGQIFILLYLHLAMVANLDVLTEASSHLPSSTSRITKRPRLSRRSTNEPAPAT